MVSGTDDYTMDIGELSTVFEVYSSWYWLKCVVQLGNFFCMEDFESTNLSRNASRTRREQARREVKSAVPRKLGYLLCFRAYLPSNVCGRHAGAD